MQLFDTRPERPGYRLQSLEVFNWGAFDSSRGQVFRVEPEGRTSLLVGHNGSGKSTLVDAITTLLVDTRSRKYNSAAGAERSERSLKTYIKGAYDRTADESRNSAVQYLRPKGNHLSAIAAVFGDEQLGRSFTLLQVLFLKNDGSDDKVYAIVDEHRQLQHTLDGLRKSDQVREHLKNLGYQTTKSYSEYLGWLTRRTGMRGKAVDMFNQTIAVKDIQSLNEFIRKHMLESHAWGEKVQRLLTHFNDLSAAHQELVRAKQQVELLQPIQRLGAKHRELSKQLTAVEAQMTAAPTFFQRQIVDLFQTEIDRRQTEHAAMAGAIARLESELETQREHIRQLQNEIDHAGGDRLKQIPRLIEIENERMTRKAEASRRYHDSLATCKIGKGKIGEEVTSAAAFDSMRDRLSEIARDAEAKIEKRQPSYEQAIGQRASVLEQLGQEQHELSVLEQRRTNLPPRFTAMRSGLCDALNLDETALPFAAELIAVDPDESRWEASAEMVLGGFGLSLLVPDRFYGRVRAYVERNRVEDHQGRGARLDYIRVGKAAESTGDRIHAASLYHKLRFKSHEFAPWIKGQIARRFNFHCCESEEEFSRIDRNALTANRHVKYNAESHKKDDRPRTVDPRFFVLGWDNTAKKKRIEASIASLEQQASELTEKIAKFDQAIKADESISRAAAAALAVTDFAEIDHHAHRNEITALEEERRQLEEGNETVKALKSRLQTAKATVGKFDAERTTKLEAKGALARQIQQAAKMVASARAHVESAIASGEFERHQTHFADIETSLGRPAPTCEDFDVRRSKWESDSRAQVAKLREPVARLGGKLTDAMARFLREFKEENDDLVASLDALDSFLGLLTQLEREDLPKYERKFKERLNDEVTKEVALFNTALNEERKEIVRKVELLNDALLNVEYDKARGTFMRLEPRLASDKEIDDFRRSLRQCLDESLDSSDEANETRFMRIKSLVERLGAKDRTTWRNKVIDVRNWYNFAALELDRETQTVRSCYEGGSGQSGGEKAKLAFTILVAALAYQFDIDPGGETPGRFQFVVVDEMFSKVDDQNACYALDLFRQFGLQLLIVAPLDAKARIVEPYVNRYVQVVKDSDTQRSKIYSMTAQEYEQVTRQFETNGAAGSRRRAKAK